MMNSKIMDSGVDALFDAILTLKNREECYSFFEDLCTVQELKAMSQRYVVASMLREKRFTAILSRLPVHPRRQ